ncbi:DUF2971 domain-containing protein [Curtobacterium sp. MCBD17_008]|uniref:DUF2971 domain-containing protein n=1 Tax=Curtobacterium sp. MCBD17_008 TaxID=2175656 RepID=UPI0011B62461|nr:DUF2971 domain-containing protein [Curtobacterium sp. MCBD17_008]
MDVTLSSVDPSSLEPSDDTVLWRYLDFPKFLDLLSSAALKMPRATSMEDAYEGVAGDAATRADLDQWREEGQPPYLRNASLSRQAFETQFHRERTYVSCWNTFETENAGLWRIYGDDRGLAIKTTWGDLRQSLGSADCVSTIFYGRVQYRNFSTDATQSETYTDQFFVKRNEFLHENEFRLVAHDRSREHNYKAPSTAGLPRYASIACDTNALINELIISPRLGSWVTDGVEAVSRKFGGSWTVRQSNLYVPPAIHSSAF